MYTFKEFLINEVRYINPNSTNETPITDGEKIRVFHGFNSFDDVIYALQYGLSGKEPARRIYSYESGNNPKGLFVTIDLKTATKFAYSKVIIEFTSKISDLEAPVWVGGRGYFIQGEYTKSFKDMNEREQQRLINRQTSSESPYDFISKSDRPELAETIFDNPERQALYIGDLNPNMIKRVWVKDNQNNWTHITPTQFLNQNKDYKIKDTYKYSEKYFKPNDDFTIEHIYNTSMKLPWIKNNKEEAIETTESFIKDVFSDFYQSEYELSKIGFFPKQIKQIMNLYKSGDWKTELENLKNKVS